MKVGILTFPNSTSYGATLQMYALYHVVNELGHDTQIINYYNAYMKAEKHKSNSHTAGMVKKAVSDLLHLPLKRRFKSFEKRRMTIFPERSFDDTQKLSELGNHYDAVICGSDQVWNPDITENDLTYFLNFCGEHTRRVSYAPSFGVKTLDRDFSDLVARELAQFYALSIRETDGQKLVMQMLGREVPIVLDPTMLLSATQWSTLEKMHPLAKDEYILYYTIKRSDSLMQFCRQLSAKTGMKIVVIGGNCVTAFKNKDAMVDYAVDISPEQWLYLVHHAAYVVTNSFHGTAFSVNFRKEFYVEFSSLTNSRLEHIVNMLELTDRIVNPDALSELFATDYTATNAKLPGLMAHSMQYLECALADGRTHG